MSQLHKVKIKIMLNTGNYILHAVHYTFLFYFYPWASDTRHWHWATKRLTNNLDIVSILELKKDYSGLSLENIASVMFVWMGQKNWRLGRRKKSQNGVWVSVLSFVASPELGCQGKD